MTVLYSELQVAGWADQYIGLDDVTYTSDSAKAFTLPCHNADPDIFFADSDLEISLAKSLCGSCPMKQACLAASDYVHAALRGGYRPGRSDILVLDHFGAAPDA